MEKIKSGWIIVFFLFVFLFFIIFFINNFENEKDMTKNETFINVKNVSDVKNVSTNILMDNKSEEIVLIKNKSKKEEKNESKKEKFQYCVSIIKPKYYIYYEENSLPELCRLPYAIYFGNNSYFSWYNFPCGIYLFPHLSTYIKSMFDEYFSASGSYLTSSFIPFEIKEDDGKLEVYLLQSDFGSFNGSIKYYPFCSLPIGTFNPFFVRLNKNFENLSFHAYDLYIRGSYYSFKPSLETSTKKLNKTNKKPFSFKWNLDEDEKKKLMKYVREEWNVKGDNIIKSKDNNKRRMECKGR